MDFLHNHLYENSQNVVLSSISGTADVNKSCVVDTTLIAANSGLMIEGLAILSSIAPNTSTHALLSDLLQGAINNTAWQNIEGIIKNTPAGGADTGDMVLPEGIAVACSRNVVDDELRAYAEAFLAVQFNAIVDFATSDGSNIYGPKWIGPPSSTFAAGNQAPALGVLNAAIGLGDAIQTSPTVSPASNPSSTSTAGRLRRSTIGPIVGGIVGGMALLALSVALWVLIRRRRRAGRKILDATPSNEFTGAPGMAGISPFNVYQASSAPQAISFSSARSQETRKSDRLQNAAPLNRTRNSWTDEKRQIHTEPSLTAGPSAIENGTESGLSQGTRSGPNSVIPASSALPTVELVRILNERLQNQEWDEEEAPPDYPVHTQ
ncbi:hypothetical protein B0H19DRAFT_1253385 [Mycena capillaripes]|nr:hypothetical protein B0H19DRAFT_1253385 [Mycena capillaripes]